ncbi:restriction endonuclease subunit S [Fibrobacter sp. UWR1]|nr:restriction endonuclease subunit S [Fibrobacter sp. UWR1]
MLKKGEFAYNRSSSTGYPFGVVKRLDRYETGVLSTLYLCMGIKNEKKCYSDFFVYLFESGCLEKQLSLICREGARNHGLLNVSKEDFFNMSVPVPSLNEQKRIAEFLLANEKELSLLKQQLALYKKQKQGLMQKLLTGEWRVK